MATTANTTDRNTGGIIEPRHGLWHTLSNAMIITRREVRDSFRDWRIIAPIIILTFLFPGLAQFVAGEFTDFLRGFSAEIIGERTIPFLLMVVGFFPISISLVIALETFVGEKERRSLEPLLSTPLTNTELYIGKTVAAMIPPLISSYGGMVVYLLSLVNGELAWRPPVMLIVQIMLLTGVQALVMVTGAVVVSSQTTSTRAANLLASFIVIPMALVIQGESVIMFLAPDADSPNGIAALWAIIVGMFFVAVLLLRVGNSIFNREELLGRTLDGMNLRGTLRGMWASIRAVEIDGVRRPARSLREWYVYGVLPSLKPLKLPIVIVFVVFVVVFLMGFVLGNQPGFQLNLNTMIEDFSPEEALRTFAEMTSSTSPAYFTINNGRILLVALILSAFSFGVAALILTPAVYGVLGFIFAQLMFAGGSGSMILLSAVVPHGLIEIPVIVLAAAASLKLGAIVTRPNPGMSIGQSWMLTFGMAMKVYLGLVIPGLVLAGLIEAYITPQVVMAVLAGMGGS